MMRLPKFDYYAPREIAEAVKIINDAGPEGQFVAGGTDLYPNMKRRQQTPKTVIGLERIAELKKISGEAKSTGLVIGAGVTLAELIESSVLGQHYPFVSETAKLISTPLLQNMGTIGGNLLLDTRCNYYDQNYEWRRGINFCLKKDGDTCWVAPSSPRCWAVQSSDLAPLMVAIGAKLMFVSSQGERLVAAEDLYNHDGISYLKKRPDELLTEIRLPPANGMRAVYKKLRRRGAFDFPVLGVAAALEFSSNGAVSKAKLILGGVAPAPVEVTDAEAALTGQPLGPEQIQAAADASFFKARPLDNTDFAMNWRKQMARPFVIRALEELATHRA